MSYKLFVTDLNEFYKDDKNKGIHYDFGQAVVRDKWMKEGRYDELIDFVLENWDSGNCDDFIEPLERKLIEESHGRRFERLWRRIIYYRLGKLLDTLKDYSSKNKNVDISEIEKIDTSDFNMFSVDSYKDIKRVLAFRRRFLLDGIRKYKNGLTTLKNNIAVKQLEDFEFQVVGLVKSKMSLKNWR